jgi:hypothetical protein
MAGCVDRAGISTYVGGSDTGLNRIPHTTPGGRVIAVCRNRTIQWDTATTPRDERLASVLLVTAPIRGWRRLPSETGGRRAGPRRSVLGR